MAVAVGVGCGDRLWWWPSDGALLAVGAALAVLGVVDGVGVPEDAGVALCAGGEPAPGDRVDRRAPVPLLTGVLEGVTDVVGVLLAVGVSLGLLVG